MQGSKEVVGMKRPGAIAGVVEKDTRRARESFVCAVGHLFAARRREDRTDEDIAGSAAVRATLTDALPSDSAVKPLKTPLGHLVRLPAAGVSDTTNS